MMTSAVSNSQSGSFGIAAGDLDPMIVTDKPGQSTITSAEMRDQPQGGTARWMFEEAARQNGFNPDTVKKGSPEDTKVTATLDRALATMAAMPKANGHASEVEQLRDVIADSVDRGSVLCRLPAVGVGGSIAGYDVLGAGVNGGVSFDPKTGRAGIAVGGEVGVGIGLRGKLVSGSQATATLGNTNGVSASVGLSANGQAGPISVGASHELVGTSMKDSAIERTQISVGLGGAGLTANANLSVGGGVAGQLYDIECPK